jgi:hypothetical protein
MNQPDPALHRLLRAASTAPAAAPVPAEPPFGFTTRVIAGWLASSAQERPGLDALWFRRAFLCAFAVMLLSIGWSYRTADSAATGDEMTIAGYDATADLP